MSVSFNFRELQYFVALAEQRHFGRAAQKVNVSQPTLSMQFKKLEQQLGADLIERLPKEALLTSLGTEVLPLAREILRLAQEIEIRCSTKSGRVRMKLGVIPTISPYLLPKISRALKNGILGRSVSLAEAQTAELVRMVKDGSIDAAIISTPLNESGIEEIEIYSEPFLLAVNRSHRLAHRKKIGIEDISEENLLLLGEGHCMRNQALSICNLDRSGSAADLSATSIETLRSMVAMGAGITLIPKLAMRRGDGVSYVPFADPSPRRSIGVIFRPSFYEREAMEELINSIRQAAAREHLQVTNSDPPP